VPPFPEANGARIDSFAPAKDIYRTLRECDANAFGQQRSSAVSSGRWLSLWTT
jgi:hypothetical protein